MPSFRILGSFQAINAEEVEEEVSGMWRTLFKLTKTFSDVPGPRRVADSTKSKIDKFKVYLPLLGCICNPGLRDRHWEQVCSIDLLIYHRNPKVADHGSPVFSTLCFPFCFPFQVCLLYVKLVSF